MLLLVVFVVMPPPPPLELELWLLLLAELGLLEMVHWILYDYDLVNNVDNRDKASLVPTAHLASLHRARKTIFNRKVGFV